MPKYIMALDAGTTSNRCILFDEAGHIIFAETHTVTIPEVLKPYMGGLDYIK